MDSTRLEWVGSDLMEVDVDGPIALRQNEWNIFAEVQKGRRERWAHSRALVRRVLNIHLPRIEFRQLPARGI